MPLTRSRPRLYYERHGSGEPVLCLTGYGLSAAIFEPVLDLYSSEWEAVLYDHRGAGRSEAPPWLASMHQLAADAVRLLDELEIEAAHVYGVSFGSMVAQEVAIRFPDRVRGLVLGGATCGGPRAYQPDARGLGGLGARMLVEAVGSRGPGLLGPALLSEQFRRSEPERTRELLRPFYAHRARLRGINSHWWASVYHDTYSRLPRITAPTLVMHGELDAMSPLANAELLARRIPDAELAVLAGCGHAYPLEAPERSHAIFAGWIERRSPIAPGPPPARRSRLTEPLLRPLGLHAGALRTGFSLAARLAGRGR
ncbi:MAG: alpha/beta fold hydrolase [Solirubrobacterales bacterium]